jgi:hypothetical protein
MKLGQPVGRNPMASIEKRARLASSTTGNWRRRESVREGWKLPAAQVEGTLPPGEGAAQAKSSMFFRIPPEGDAKQGNGRPRSALQVGVLRGLLRSKTRRNRVVIGCAASKRKGGRGYAVGTTVHEFVGSIRFRRRGRDLAGKVMGDP